MPQEPDDREYTPDESRLKTSFRECIPLFIALGDSTRLAIIQQLYEVEENRRSLETEQKGGRSGACPDGQIVEQFHGFR